MTRSLPNKNLTETEFYNLFEIETGLFGGEGSIIPSEEPGEVRKVFFYPFQGQKEDLENYYKITQNKLEKLKLLYQMNLENLVFPTRTLSYEDFIVGYDMTAVDCGIKENLTLEDLQRLKEKLKIFHQHGVIHGDIKRSNILISKTGQLALCDLDNMQIEDYPIDRHNYYISYFCNGDLLVDENADIYLYNLLFLQQLSKETKEYDTIINEILFEELKDKLPDTMQDELFKMQSSFTGYHGNYLINYINDKNKEVKTYGKIAKGNSSKRYCI